MSRVIKKIVVHHTGAKNPSPQFEAIDGWHKDRLFPKSSLGYYVGYHYVIEEDGSVVRARVDEEIGAHDHRENEHSIGIGLVGNFNQDLPTVEQENALGALLVGLLTKHELTVWDVEPHRAFDTTDCYGTKLNNGWASSTALKYALYTFSKITGKVTS